MSIVTIGIDLAKNVIAVHGLDATGKAVLVRPSVPRAKLLELIASLPPSIQASTAQSISSSAGWKERVIFDA